MSRNYYAWENVDIAEHKAYKQRIPLLLTYVVEAAEVAPQSQLSVPGKKVMNPQSFTLTKKLFLLLILCMLSTLFLRGVIALSIAQLTEERTLEDKVPKHVPIKVKMRIQKEKAFKDAKNENWVRDFALEVTNTSEKPIYFLELWLIYPEIIEPNGGPVGVPLRYGRMDFIRFKTRPTEDDVPIKPGETYTYSIPEKDQRGWYARKARGYMSDPKKVLLKFVQLNFGDGTGFNHTDAKPYPYKKEQSSNGRCEDPKKAVGMK
jgi:hypothetical protein